MLLHFLLEGLAGPPSGGRPSRARSAHGPRFRSLPHVGQRPGSPRRQSGFIGIAIWTRSSAIGASGDDRVVVEERRRGRPCASSTSSGRRGRARVEDERERLVLLRRVGGEAPAALELPVVDEPRRRARIPPRCARPRPPAGRARARRSGSRSSAATANGRSKLERARARRARIRGRWCPGAS